MSRDVGKILNVVIILLALVLLATVFIAAALWFPGPAEPARPMTPAEQKKADDDMADFMMQHVVLNLLLGD